MEAGTLTKVLHDFSTTVAGELSLKKGAYFLVQNVIDKHWCYGNSHTDFGKFPISHLLEVSLPMVKDTESIYIAIAEFKGQQFGDLHFNTGEIIIGNPVTTSSMLMGHTDSRSGTFPASYVWQLDVNRVKKNLQRKFVNKKAKVKISLKAQLEEELDLNKGETIMVTEILKDGWCQGCKENGKTGTFPESFIVYLEDAENNEPTTSTILASYDNISTSTVSEKICNKFKESDTSDVQLINNNLLHGHIDPVEKNKAFLTSLTLPQPYAISLFSFAAQFSNELNFEAGQVINLTRYVDNDWAEGMIGHLKGIFPVSYVDIIVDCPDFKIIDECKDNVAQVQNMLTLNNSVRVKYTFDAQTIGDLSVSEGEMLTIVNITSDKWVTVKNNKNEVGLCPREYLDTNVESDCINQNSNFTEINNKKKFFPDEVTEKKNLTEPHRPAPPIPVLKKVPILKQDKPKTFDCEIHDPSKEVRKANQRRNVITELYQTEKDYIRDLKLTFETFDLHNPNFLQSKGIDVSSLFGNVSEIIEVAEQLLRLIQEALEESNEDNQVIGSCFLKMSEKMRIAYGKYCNNHELSLIHLQKYEDDAEVTKIFEIGVETLRMQIACFDMNSILIKPVQRILKYPLILNELSKCTNDDHVDKLQILEASKVMADVASYINEYKRKKELTSKYLHSSSTFLGKMANLNIHSVAKKSSRLSAKLSASLGLTNLPMDDKFDELSKTFFSLEKHVRLLLKDVEHCVNHLDEETYCGDILCEQLHQFFTGTTYKDVSLLRETKNSVRCMFLKELKEIVSCQVVTPLAFLISLMSGPELLIHKRQDKMLDYDSAISRNEKLREKGTMQDDLLSAKSNFEALNQQLLEELPSFIDISSVILYNCIVAFTNARKMLNGKIMKNYLTIIERIDQVIIDNILESFLVNHNLLNNQMNRLCYGGTNSHAENYSVDLCLQSKENRNAVKAKYPPNKIYVVTCSVVSTMTHDLSATEGTILGVIKTQDPMGNSLKWFVDNGSSKGFICSQYLEPTEEAKSIEGSTTVRNIKNKDFIDFNVCETEVNKLSDFSQENSYYMCDQLDNVQKDNNILDLELIQMDRNINEEFVYSLYDFHRPLVPGTLSVKRGQALKVLIKHDEKKNCDWWLVEDRTGGRGYVPCNHLKAVH